MNPTRKLLVFAAALWISVLAPVRAQTNCETDAVFGGPPRWATQTGHETILVLTNCAYIVGYSEARKDPLWVCYHLRKVGAVGQKAPNPPRKNNFKVDNRTAAKVKYGDFGYKSTHLDAGHMAPSYGIGSRYGVAAQDETFLMSNMCPQLDTLNRRTWARLESKEADNLANGVGEVWIIDGPIFDAHTTTIGTTGISRPEAFYKIILDGRNGKERVLAFRIFQTTIPTQNPDQFLTSVGTVENLTGLDFFAALPPTLRTKLEGQKPVTIWKVK
jgi:endonuclease G